MTNLKFAVSESVRGSVHILTKPMFLLSILNFLGYPENAPSHILLSNLEEKTLKQP